MLGGVRSVVIAVPPACASIMRRALDGQADDWRSRRRVAHLSEHDTQLGAAARVSSADPVELRQTALRRGRGLAAGRRARSGLGISSAIRQIQEETGSYAALLQQSLAGWISRNATRCLSPRSGCAVSAARSTRRSWPRSRGWPPTSTTLPARRRAGMGQGSRVWSRRQAASPMTGRPRRRRVPRRLDHPGGQLHPATAAHAAIRAHAHARRIIGRQLPRHRAQPRGRHDRARRASPVGVSGRRNSGKSSVIGFRVEYEVRQPRMTSLSSQPRRAADQVLPPPTTAAFSARSADVQMNAVAPSRCGVAG